MDCSDGSDEYSKYCDLSQTENVFVCCTSNTVIPLSKVCDDYDDCPRDKSDQYLNACRNKTGSLMCLAPITMPITDSGYEVITIREDQFNDGQHNCQFGVDEVCIWKDNLEQWISPFDNDEFERYMQFLDFLGTAPSFARWFLMAETDDILEMGHQYKVRFSKYLLLIVTYCDPNDLS